MNGTGIISDIDEAVAVIETYKLSGLVWAFEDCPLKEIKNYVPRGKGELVVVSHKGDGYLAYRLIFDPGDYNLVQDDFKITFDFHKDYYIHIILKTVDFANE